MAQFHNKHGWSTKLNKKIQKKVATRAAFIKVVKNTLEDLNIIYNDYINMNDIMKNRHFPNLMIILSWFL